MKSIRFIVSGALLAFAFSAQARDSLGVWGEWAAFRDPQVPRCYAIALASRSSRGEADAGYLTVGLWPKAQVRGQVHVHLSRPGANLKLALGGQQFPLVGNGQAAWLADARGDAAVIAAMRSAGELVVSGRDATGRGFTDRYALPGVASAMDAATIACAAR